MVRNVDGSLVESPVGREMVKKGTGIAEGKEFGIVKALFENAYRTLILELFLIINFLSF